MVERREIRISIDKTGNVTLEPVNAKGGACVGWTAPLEEALGKTTARDFKPEYFENTHDEVTASSDGSGREG